MTSKIDAFEKQWRVLSNFYPVEIIFEGETYGHIEAAYQAAKTLVIDERKQFKNVGPGEAKRRGQRVSLRRDWEQAKLGIMEELLRQKFTREPERSALLSTGEAELIEGNWWGDTYWGVCKGVGENHLGKLLMKIRAELRGQREGG